MISKEIVKRAIHMDGPPRLPFLFANRDFDMSDISVTIYREAEGYGGLNSEWGFTWEKLDDTMGQPKCNSFKSWDDFAAYNPPDADSEGRYDHIPKFVERCKDKYLLGELGSSGFNRVTFIRGFEETLTDLYLERANIEKLIDIVFQLKKG